jgi:hypothetical protein
VVVDPLAGTVAFGTQAAFAPTLDPFDRPVSAAAAAAAPKPKPTPVRATPSMCVCSAPLMHLIVYTRAGGTRAR